ncbi:hypothetical protein KZX46_10450 [Polymorphobacter sp. PAMC 29334]|uniref:hypothetical protein n=1 Tax=Polymorphobacter sp. PAMC 29334 TaxID=2862331 RepID=UPI001C77D308|nr:hypothetical protein [Polymorphobacter sp. PAMC 29334]QYE36303.1 hypothetical protein KZX46_10450 [Polymorphobacter sp. PAMC 29334]
MSVHFIISNVGDVIEPDGYSLALSSVLVAMTADVSIEYRSRILGFLRRYLNFEHLPGEHPRMVLEESADDAVERVKAYFLSTGVPVVPSRKPNCEHELDLRVPDGQSTVHAQQKVTILRQFHQLCGSLKVGGRTAENPIELPGWHQKSEEDRRESWRTRHGDTSYGWLNAGLRFKTSTRTAYLPLIENPSGCAEKMTLAMVKHGCPATIVAICHVLEENGCRWREAAWANALGWSLRGFGEIVHTTNKFEADEHAKKIMLAPDVLSDIIRRFEAQPHPKDGGRSMIDHLRELATAGDKAALRAIPLFPNSRGGFHQHRTFNGHWFRPAMEAWENEDGSRGLLIHSDVSARRPTPHWYRHAEITRELEQAVAECRTDAEILEACRSVCRSFSLKTDQASRYAAALMRRLANETQMRRIRERRAGNEARRRAVDLPIAVGRLELSEAERLLMLLPVRRMEAA